MAGRRTYSMSLPPKVKDLQGQVFCELQVLDFVALGKRGAIWRCRCDCGNVVEVPAPDLKAGNTRSCGCRRRRLMLASSTKHGQTTGKHHTEYLRAYKIWRGMLNRCRNKSCKAYPDYGGRGITVCDKWQSDFKAFYADMGDPPDWGTLERKDVNKGYSKENCRWASLAEQARNKRNTVKVVLNGEEMIQADAARKLGINPGTVCRWRKNVKKIPVDIDLVFLTQ